MKKTRVALLSGGISSERAVSLASGNQVFAALDKQKYDIRRYDPQSDLPRLVAEAPRIDVALVILHGPFGEDGTVQGLLDLLGIPYQGSGVLGSAIAMNKLVSKQLYEKFGIPVPPYLALTRRDRLDPEAIGQRLGFPLVIKPVSGGSSIGMSLVKSPEALAAGIDQALQYDSGVLLEVYLAGVELTCGVIGNEHLEALPLIEIIPDKAHPFFDYTAKYTAGATQEICPARIDPALAEKAQSYGLMAHRALNCRGYSRTDMILKDGEIFVLETNTIPGMTPTSLMPQAARAAGMSFSQLLDRLIALALEDRPPRAGGAV
ncbi:MAG TPA: D-alanine--D-alanine ligase [Desulfobacterales bacterium]|jgi:D-alanine-D-alanine ligase|nr:D-alanine--D-alanine ligase [Desulfobacterales bacterium]